MRQQAEVGPGVKAALLVSSLAFPALLCSWAVRAHGVNGMQMTAWRERMEVQGGRRWNPGAGGGWTFHTASALDFEGCLWTGGDRCCESDDVGGTDYAKPLLCGDPHDK